jgi:hypothetical protein
MCGLLWRAFYRPGGAHVGGFALDKRHNVAAAVLRDRYAATRLRSLFGWDPSSVSVCIFVVDGEAIALGRLRRAGYLRPTQGQNATDATSVFRCGFVRLRLHYQHGDDPQPSRIIRVSLVTPSATSAQLGLLADLDAVTLHGQLRCRSDWCSFDPGSRSNQQLTPFFLSIFTEA